MTKKKRKVVAVRQPKAKLIRVTERQKLAMDSTEQALADYNDEVQAACDLRDELGEDTPISEIHRTISPDGFEGYLKRWRKARGIVIKTTVGMNAREKFRQEALSIFMRQLGDRIFTVGEQEEELADLEDELNEVGGWA